MPVDPLSPAAAAASGDAPKRERSPPQSPQSPTAKHPRTSVDMDDVIAKLEKALSEQDNHIFIQETVQSIKKLYEVTKDQANFLN